MPIRSCLLLVALLPALGCNNMSTVSMCDVDRGFQWIDKSSGASIRPSTSAMPDSARKVTISDPGWFDVGVGSGIAFDTDSAANNDASGFLAALKAYPGGRWYTADSNGVTRAIAERNTFWNRFSFAYGISTDGFQGGGIDGPVQAIGLSFDFTPELAIMGGWSFFEHANQERHDTDNGMYVGIVINLNSFVDQFLTTRRAE
ncbi:MAG: hypothetical protein KDC98_07025 [Planctomycetes bacterium]|nr:hypothetical protein [Planctomycetota bacterium]